ncbi:MAG: hypothetical protein GY839_04965, partial [candidate division Zixibacteria bacterium]|nr:hypothetical protein [candidate division Zixibacteria bacterium]
MIRCKSVLFVLAIILISILVSSSSKAQITFNEFIIDDSFDAVAIHACDFEGDEDLDVVAAGIDSGLALWLNEGGYPVQWSRQTIEDDFYGAITIYAIDIDDDGDTDILGGAWYSHEVAWWRNDGGDPVVWT